LNKFSSKKKISILALSSLSILSQVAMAHTDFQISNIDENNAQFGSNYNNQVINHGCSDPKTGKNRLNTLGTVVVFPDGVDSTITVDGVSTSKPLTDFVTNWGDPVAKIQNKDVFTTENEIITPQGNTVGYWAGGGSGLQGGLTGVIPFRTRGVVINPDSCAKSVKFIVAIADICKITKVSDFSDSTAMLWTPAIGSNFDGLDTADAYNSPASLTVNRTITPLPTACGKGVDVIVTPSAAQLNRDMPIKVKGVQIWPKQ